MNGIDVEQNNEEDQTMALDEVSEEDTVVSRNLLDTAISGNIKDDEQVDKTVMAILCIHIS